MKRNVYGCCSFEALFEFTTRACTCVLQAYGKSYALGASIKFVYDAQQFVGPLLLERLITFLQEKDDEANLDDYQAPPMRVGYVEPNV